MLHSVVQKHWGFWLMLLALAGGMCATKSQAEEANIEVLAPLDAFENPSKDWVAQCGSNIKCEVSATTAAEKKGLLFKFDRVNLQENAPNVSWLNLVRLFNTPVSCPGAEGVRVVFSASEEQDAYLSFGFVDRAKKECQPPSNVPYLICKIGTDKMVALIPFSCLKSKTGGKISKAEDILKLTFGGRAPLGTITIHELNFYRKLANTGWLQFKSRADNPSNLFQPNQPVTFVLKALQQPPAGVDAIRYEVRDYFDKVAAENSLKLEGKTEFEITLPTLTAGYYEVRAFALDAQGKQQERSCLKTGFSMQPGVNTFAVLPCTLEENIARIRKVGPENAFFGIQNILRTKYKLHELLGMPWIMNHPSWNWSEQKAPVRQNGEAAEWAKAAIEKSTALPDYFYGVTAYNVNHLGDIPAWATSGSDQYPGFKSWEDLGGFLKDSARVNMHLFPAQQVRLYEGAWEMHLSRKPWTTKLIYSPEQVVELLKNVRQSIKQVDPQAKFIGAGFGTFSGADYFSEMFKHGLLDQLDGISLHCYTQNPEGLGGELDALRKLMRETVGKEVPLYDTECGYTSYQGGQTLRLREQAQLNVRQNIVLKGEGVKLHLTFYPFDHGTDGEGTYGLFFYESGAKIDNFGPELIAPKPAAAALAVCSAQLMDTMPASKLDWWGNQLYGYVFQRGKEPVVALWSTGGERKIQLPVGNVKSVHVVDIMGRGREAAVENGLLALNVDGNPLYISGASAAIYLAPGDHGQAVYPGQTVNLAVPVGSAVKSAQAWGCQVESGKVRIKPDTPAGPLPVVLSLADSQGAERAWVSWLLVQSPVELRECAPQMKEKRLGVQLRLRNHAEYPIALSLQAAIRGSGKWSTLTGQTLSAGKDEVYFLPLSETAVEVDPCQMIAASIRIDAGKGGQMALEKNLSFLCAAKSGAVLATPYTDTVHLSGVGSSGTTDEADIRFAWNEKGLALTITRKDDVQRQPYAGGDLWRGDSIQMAFDTDPDSENPYNPVAFHFSKKITEIGFTRTDAGAEFWRFRTHNENELPLGKISGAAMEWKRDESAKTTTMNVIIPWKEIGLNGVQAGKQIGIAVLLNDLDGDKTERKCLGLFGGINDDKSFRRLGRLTLQ